VPLRDASLEFLVAIHLACLSLAYGFPSRIVRFAPNRFDDFARSMVRPSKLSSTSKTANEKTAQLQWMAVFLPEMLCKSEFGLVRRRTPRFRSGFSLVQVVCVRVCLPLNPTFERNVSFVRTMPRSGLPGSASALLGAVRYVVRPFLDNAAAYYCPTGCSKVCQCV
jgi:hypothetical protein